MTYSTTNTFKMKRKILNFVEKISANTYRPQKKFMADIIYGMLASGSSLNFCLSICMVFLGNMEGKCPTNKLRNTIIEVADPIKKKVYFQYYRIASGVS